MKKSNIRYGKTKDGNTTFSASKNGIKLSGMCNESMIVAKLATKDNILYELNESNIDAKSVKEGMNKLINMYNKSAKAMFKEAEDLDMDKDKKEKELLLDDEDSDFEIVADEPETDESDIIDDEPVDDSQLDILENSVEKLNSLKAELDDFAIRASKLLNDFTASDTKNRLLAVGLTASIYSVIDDLNDFIDSNISESDTLNTVEDEIEENLCVPAKTDYMKIATGCVSKACSALRKTDNKDILDVLKDIKSEMVIRR